MPTVAPLLMNYNLNGLIGQNSAIRFEQQTSCVKSDRSTNCATALKGERHAYPLKLLFGTIARSWLYLPTNLSTYLSTYMHTYLPTSIPIYLLTYVAYEIVCEEETALICITLCFCQQWTRSS